MDENEPIPPARVETVRQALLAALAAAALPVSVLSQRLGESEKVLLDHLQSLQRAGRVEVCPPTCGHCGFAFAGRTRVTKPGRCPRCKSTRIPEPRYRQRPPGHDKASHRSRRDAGSARTGSNSDE